MGLSRRVEQPARVFTESSAESSHGFFNPLFAAILVLSGRLLLALTLGGHGATSALALPAEPAYPAPRPALSTNSVVSQPTLLLVVGAAGDTEYGQVFEGSARRWHEAACRSRAKIITIGLQAGAVTNDHHELQQALDAEPKDGANPLWLVLIGHGTFDGKDAKFNLRGADLPASELAAWLQPFRRPLTVINTASASAPFLSALSAPTRIVITATRSGAEQNFTRFGQYLAEAIADPAADLDHDGQTSLLEAFLKTAHDVAEFYRKENRLATEHPLLDDNGDAQGTPPDWFRGARAIKKAKDGATADGLRAHQWHLVPSERERQLAPSLRSQRDALEASLSQLREEKAQRPSAEYYQRLEQLLLELARVYEKASSAPAAR